MATIDELFPPKQDQAKTIDELFPVKEKERSWYENAVGALENIRAIGGGIISEPIAGLAGLADAGAEALGFQGFEGTPADTVERVRQSAGEMLSPTTEAGKEQQQAIGEFMQPVGELMQNIQQGAGDFVFEKTGSPLAASLATAAPDALMTIIGSAPVAQASRSFNTAAKNAIANTIKNSPRSLKAAEYMVNAAGKIKKSKAFPKVKSMGFDPSVMATVKGSTPADKLKMAQMVGRLEKGMDDALYAVKNRPTDIVGNSALERVKFIKVKNRQAGKQLDSVAKSLKGQQVNLDPVVDDFISNLNDIGVKLNSKNKPVFSGSDIEGATAAENFIRKVVKRMRETKPPDAYDAHRLKRYIDEQVSYGKVGEGLSGRAENIVKNLRRNIDSTLDNNFPSYDKVNTQYSDTVNALDNLQSALGRIDLSAPNSNQATGTALRRVMSNAQSRGAIMNSLDELDNIAAKYGGKFDDDIVSQALFADELDSAFNLQNRTTFKGQTARGLQAAAEGQGGITRAAIDKLGEGIDKVRGFDDKARVEALKELLREGQR